MTAPQMIWPALTKGTFVQRYKRFMVDVLLEDGATVTAHCANSGSMRGLCEPGRTVYLSRSDNPKRRLPYTWEMIDLPSSLVCVNTSVTNSMVKAAISDGLIPGLSGYQSIRSEVTCRGPLSDAPHKVGKSRGASPKQPLSRIDLLLESDERPQCFVEVKSCTLVEGKTAFFPDAKTERGLKHVKELEHQVTLGDRAVMFFLIQRMDAELFKPAEHIDPAYSAELGRAVAHGVEVFCYDVKVTPADMTVRLPVPAIV